MANIAIHSRTESGPDRIEGFRVGRLRLVAHVETGSFVSQLRPLIWGVQGRLDHLVGPAGADDVPGSGLTYSTYWP